MLRSGVRLPRLSVGAMLRSSFGIHALVPAIPVFFSDSAPFLDAGCAFVKLSTLARAPRHALLPAANRADPRVSSWLAFRHRPNLSAAQSGSVIGDAFSTFTSTHGGLSEVCSLVTRLGPALTIWPPRSMNSDHSTSSIWGAAFNIPLSLLVSSRTLPSLSIQR